MRLLETIIFTGVSGGGKTTALHAVEDLGFYCTDNLPLPLLSDFIETMKVEPSVDRAALVMDARLRSFLKGSELVLSTLKASGHVIDIVYLDANVDVLIRRFSQTRRRHPLGDANLCQGFQEEQSLLAPLRAHASVCIDTSELTPHELKRLIQDRYQGKVGRNLVVSLMSFGFRYGIPSYADIVLDARFLPNPFFQDELRHLNGQNKPVFDFVLQSPDAKKYVSQTVDMFEFLLPRFEEEGKVYLTVAVGCTGGRHRSVAIVEELFKRLGKNHRITIHHRDIER